MNLNSMMKMENWETKMDNMDLQHMLVEINRALHENLAAELGFPSFDLLESASECIVDEYYVTHLSDGRYVWWNPQKYKTEDPVYFQDDDSIVQYIVSFLKLNDQQRFQLSKGLKQIPQMRKCLCCEHEFNPVDIQLLDGEVEDHQKNYCSTDCAMETIMGEIKEDF